jgi:hypothetical protein
MLHVLELWIWNILNNDVFHLLTKITSQMDQCFNNKINQQLKKNLDHHDISLEVMPFRSKKWDLRNWIETGHEGIFTMRICRDVYKDLFRNS